MHISFDLLANTLLWYTKSIQTGGIFMFKLKALALGFVVSVLVSCGSETHGFVPDNELWREDCLNCESVSLAPVTQELFVKIVEAGKKAYASNAKANYETLIINAKWTDPTVNANCLRSGGKVTVNMFGGLARRSEITPQGFALVLSHELGHAYGGTPYVNWWNKMSAEGQSDWMATKDGYRKIAALVPELSQTPSTDPFVKKACKGKTGTAFIDCIHSLDGGNSLGALLAVLSEEPIPNYETPDPTVVTKTELSYPKTVQCRLDTYFAGTLNLARPKCWFFK